MSTNLDNIIIGYVRNGIPFFCPEEPVVNCGQKKKPPVAGSFFSVSSRNFRGLYIRLLCTFLLYHNFLRKAIGIFRQYSILGSKKEKHFHASLLMAGFVVIVVNHTVLHFSESNCGQIVVNLISTDSLMFQNPGFS